MGKHKSDLVTTGSWNKNQDVKDLVLHFDFGGQECQILGTRQRKLSVLVTDTEKGGIRESSICKSNDEEIDSGIYSFNKYLGSTYSANNSYYKCWRHNSEKINSSWQWWGCWVELSEHRKASADICSVSKMSIYRDVAISVKFEVTLWTHQRHRNRRTRDLNEKEKKKATIEMRVVWGGISVAECHGEERDSLNLENNRSSREVTGCENWRKKWLHLTWRRLSLILKRFELFSMPYYSLKSILNSDFPRILPRIPHYNESVYLLRLLLAGTISQTF